MSELARQFNNGYVRSAAAVMGLGIAASTLASCSTSGESTKRFIVTCPEDTPTLVVTKTDNDRYYDGYSQIDLACKDVQGVISREPISIILQKNNEDPAIYERPNGVDSSMVVQVEHTGDLSIDTSVTGYPANIVFNPGSGWIESSSEVTDITISPAVQ